MTAIYSDDPAASMGNAGDHWESFKDNFKYALPESELNIIGGTNASAECESEGISASGND